VIQLSRRWRALNDDENILNDDHMHMFEHVCEVYALSTYAHRMHSVYQL
jgi:hypothetical protein